MLIVTKDNFKTEVEEHKGLVVIDLYADLLPLHTVDIPISGDHALDGFESFDQFLDSPLSLSQFRLLL